MLFRQSIQQPATRDAGDKPRDITSMFHAAKRVATLPSPLLRYAHATATPAAAASCALPRQKKKVDRCPTRSQFMPRSLPRPRFPATRPTQVRSCSAGARRPAAKRHSAAKMHKGEKTGGLKEPQKPEVFAARQDLSNDVTAAPGENTPRGTTCGQQKGRGERYRRR